MKWLSPLLLDRPLVLFFLFYAAVTLVAGTVTGLARPSTDAAMLLLLVAVLLAAALLRPRSRVGGGFEIALLAWLSLAVELAFLAPCPERSLHLAVEFAAAAAFFYLVLDADRESVAPAMALTATAAALFGLGAWLLGYAPRVAAPLGQHHYAAGFLLLHIPLTAGLLRRHPFWSGALAAQVLALLGTRSLAGMVGLVVLGLWTLRRERRALVAAALALVAVAALVPRTRALLTRGEDPSLSLENRIRYLRTGAAMIAARPFGWGLGSVPLVAARYRPQTPDVMPQGEALPHLHNLPIHLATETGIPGLLLAAWLLWRVRSLPLAVYVLFALADYQLDMPALLFPLAAVAALSAPRVSSAPLAGPVRIALVLVAAIVPFPSRCGWDDFERGEYVAAATPLPDLIPVSAAAGASLVVAGRPTEAIPYLERAAQLDSYFTLAHFHLGRARASTGDRPGAVAAFARALLVQPITLFAEGWEEGLYRDSVARALEQLDALSKPVAFDARTRHRHDELRAFLEANRAAPLSGTYRRVFSEISDADLAHNTSLLVFHSLGAPKYTSGVTVLLPKPDFYIPPGIGYLRGLPEVKSAYPP